MKTVWLVRGDPTIDGTFGKVYFGDRIVYSGELGWYDNTPKYSSIPADVYRCSFTYSPLFKKNMFLVNNVPGRSGIRIHSANYMGDSRQGKRCHLEGCIALGMRRGTMEGQAALLNSRTAIKLLEDWAKGEDFALEIV